MPKEHKQAPRSDKFNNTILAAQSLIIDSKIPLPEPQEEPTSKVDKVKGKMPVPTRILLYVDGDERNPIVITADEEDWDIEGEGLKELSKRR